jgi:hypothetical protein
LLAALKKDSDLSSRSVGADGVLDQVDCYKGFATAKVFVKGEPRDGRVLFGYDESTGTWRPLNIGSANFCEGYVPSDIAKHFEGCM